MAYGFSNENDEDINGQDYIDYIELCFKYSQYVSLFYEPFTAYGRPNSSGVSELKELQPYRIGCITKNDWPLTTGIPCTVCIYSCEKDVKKLFETRVNSLFEWQSYWDGCHNPQDPTFFRKDGSVFSYTSIHEGFSEVYNREGEDVKVLASNPKWRYFESDCQWILPQRISEYILKRLNEYK